VHDLFLTETAAYADIVLPATSSFENTDLYMSYWHHYSQIQQPVIAPYAGSKSNVDVFRLLAAAMGFEEQAFKDTEAEMIAQALDNPDNPHLRGVTYESLVEKQFVKGRTQTILDNPLKTPSGKIELYSKRMQLHGYPPLPAYIPLPVDEYPFYFVPAPNHNFLNSTFSNNDKHVRMEKTMKLHMHVQDAARLGIAGGDCVRIWNDGGECELTAAVGEDVLPGVLVSQGLWADAEGKKFLVNALAPDRVADMGDGATFFSGRVDAELVRR